MIKIIDYKKYAKLFIEDISQVLTNSERKLESQEKTVRTYEDRLKVLINYLISKKVDIKKMDKYDIEKMFKHIQSIGYISCGKRKVYSKSTMRLFKVVGRKYFEFLKSEKVIKRDKFNPFSEKLNINISNTLDEDMKKTKEKFLSENDISRVLEYVKKAEYKKQGRKKETFYKLYEAVLLMMTFGLRVSELKSLERSDFTFPGNGLIKLHVKPSKRLKERNTYYIFNSDYREEIESIIKCSRFDYNINTIKQQIQRISKELNIPHMSTHSFRHTFGTQAINKGINTEVIAAMMGHSDTKTTKIYAKLLDIGIEESLSKVI